MESAALLPRWFPLPRGRGASHTVAQRGAEKGEAVPRVQPIKDACRLVPISADQNHVLWRTEATHSMQQSPSRLPVAVVRLFAHLCGVQDTRLSASHRRPAMQRRLFSDVNKSPLLSPRARNAQRGQQFDCSHCPDKLKGENDLRA
jgi:hypothetical protein